jgi:arylsulfatase A-like enzyme
MPKFDGKDLLQVITEKAKTKKRIYIEDHEERAVIDGKWKYTRNYFDGKEELFNIKNDPMEIINLAAKFENRTKAMRNRLFNWVDQNLKGQPDPLWTEIAEWSARWAVTFKKDFPDLKPRPTIIKNVDKS